MTPSFQVVIFLACLFQLSSSAFSPALPQQPQQQAEKEQAAPNVNKEPTWAPATQPREFGYTVLDGIKGASQMRHEKWDNGTVRGMYATPLGNNQFTVVHYLADQNGFQILSSKTMSEADLMHDEAAEKDQVKVNTNVDGSETNYKLSAQEIADRQKYLAQQQAQQASSRIGRNSGDESAQDKQKQVYEAEAAKILDFLEKKANGTQPQVANAKVPSSSGH